MPDRILRIREVVHRTGLSRPTIYRLVERGEFPHQVQLSAQCVGWKESEVAAWIEERCPTTALARS